MIALVAFLAHNTLIWDQPYQPPVRCYASISGALTAPYEVVPGDGACHPVREMTIPAGTPVRFTVRGFNEHGESNDSNAIDVVWPYVCECIVRNSAPTSLPGCQIFVWDELLPDDTLERRTDRTEFIDCVEGAP